MPIEPTPARRPLTREQANRSFRIVTAAIVITDGWLLVAAGTIAAFGVDGWPIVLGAALLLLATTPLVLGYLRRQLDIRVQAAEAELGKAPELDGT